MDARIYSYGSKDLFTVEFNGQARPTPKAHVIAFAKLAADRDISIIIDMSHRGMNAADLELSDALTAQHIPHIVHEA